MSRDDIKIVFENENWLVLDKPAGLLSVRGREYGAKDLATTVRDSVLDVATAQGFGELFPVHRLDKEVSGVLLIARNKNAQILANSWFEKRIVKKDYHALTAPGVGAPPTVGELICLKLFRGKKRTFVAEHGKDSVTEIVGWRGVAGRPWSWYLRPHTGRSHQLRVSLATRGTPILGDLLYGADAQYSQKWGFGPGTMGLRALKLDFSGVSNTQLMGLPTELIVNETQMSEG